MKKCLIVVDMQNDFVNGSLGTSQAASIVPIVKNKVMEFRKESNLIIFTKDTHDENYLKTQEGMLLPVLHCIKGTVGHKIVSDLDTSNCWIFEKTTFGSLKLAEALGSYEGINSMREIEICGLCTDICVVSNALILKTKFPEITITVDSNACAGVTHESHEAALQTMKICQVNVL